MATQDFVQIAEPKVSSHIRLALNGVTEGITGRTVIRTNQTGESVIALNMYKPVHACEKMGLSDPTPEAIADLEQRIIKPKAFHIGIPTDWESVNKLNHNPRGPLSELIVNSLKEAMEREVIKAAFRESIIGPYNTNTTPAKFDENMIVRLGDRIPGGSSQFDNTTADRLLLARQKLQRNGVKFQDRPVYLAMTSEAHTTLFGDIRTFSKDFVRFTNMEKGDITHFAGFDIIITDFLPGGKKQPFEYINGKLTNKPCIPIPQLPKDAPKEALPVKSYALYFDKPALETAIWKDVSIEVGSRPDKSFSRMLYGSFQMGCVRTEESRIGYIEMPA